MPRPTVSQPTVPQPQKPGASLPQSLSDPLHRLTHAYKSRLRELIVAEGIPLPITQIRVLKGVCRNPSCTAHTIATHMRRDKAQITRVLNELMHAELIIKVDNPGDRRSQLLQPTDAGREIMRRLQAVEARVTAQMTQQLSAEEVSMFIQLSRKMTDSLGHAQPSTQSGES
ncbi:MarR family winged helix-turn-helix transcriptional regulator [Pseudomaricurvus alcaniphilus]|uniref:MarR family winged helix-turn-helix transcriptional regulator n=1 Tax=Pseudomaricurvus alcaniphilus TaxID=1166482 RepID=UPI001FB5BF9A|nr:MarR family transcriptional regulator [Pseudomaricurvus alcaniphilus]